MLERKFAAVSEQMKARLTAIRASYQHRGIKGCKVEDIVREFLREHLPRRLDIGHGEVIDAMGHRSGQTDVVITNEDHPFTYPENEPGLFFVEGLAAAGEVKTNLTTADLEGVLEAGREFKQLRRKPTPGTISAISARPSDVTRFHRTPPFFLFALESQLALPTIWEKLKEAGSFRVDGPEIDQNTIDGVFVLDRGWVIDFAAGDGVFQFLTPDMKSLQGWIAQPSQRVLFDLMHWLSSVMPRQTFDRPIALNYLGKLVD
jgi:hypothetical protein